MVVTINHHGLSGLNIFFYIADVVELHHRPYRHVIGRPLPTHAERKDGISKGPNRATMEMRNAVFNDTDLQLSLIHI